MLAFSICFSNKAFATSPPNILSESAILIDLNTGDVLYEKNGYEKMYPASLTKIATAIYALEKGNLNDLVTISENAQQVDGTRVYLEEGEKVQLRKLIQGLLINSGNDAGVAIAEHLDGSIENFVTNLNHYLSEIGAKNTHFENPHGLFDPSHMTTAEDLAKITQYAMKNEEFREIFGTQELNWEGESWNTTIYTHHKLMREEPYDGVTGGKTGYVSQSGNTLITTAKRNDLSLIAVILKGSGQQMTYQDTVELLDYGFESFKTSFIPKGTNFTIDDNQYLTTKDFYFTHRLEDKLIKKINENGTLDILNQNQKLIASMQLEKLINKQEEVKENESSNLFWYLFIFIATLSVFLWRLRSRENRRYRMKEKNWD